MIGSRPLAIGAILCTTILWGLSFSSTKSLLGSMHPVEIAFLRLTLTILLMGAVFFLSGQKFVKGLDFWRLVACGVTGVFLYFLFENSGLRYTTASTGSLIVCTIPVINAVAGTVLLGEKHPALRWLGVFLSFMGVYVVIRTGNPDRLSWTSLKGNVLIFMAACSWVAFTRLSEPLMHKYSGIAVNFHQSLVGALLLGFLALPRGIDFSVLNSAAIFNFIYLGIFCSGVGYFLYLFALKNLGTTTVTTFLNLVPVFGVLGGAVILREALTLPQVFGALLVISGVTLVSLTSELKKPPPASD